MDREPPDDQGMVYDLDGTWKVTIQIFRATLKLDFIALHPCTHPRAGFKARPRQSPWSCGVTGGGNVATSVDGMTFLFVLQRFTS